MIETKEVNDNDNDNNEDRKIVLLLTFPNSGTTYITKLITSVTGTVTGTNYGTTTKQKKAY